MSRAATPPPDRAGGDTVADHDESLRLAIRSTLVLGVVCTAFGVAYLVAAVLLNPHQRFRPWFLGMGVALWFGPGVVFVTCAYLMRRHSRGAATGALAAVGFQALCAAALLVVSATFEPVSPVPIVLCVLWMIADADCMRRLVAARRVLRAEATRTRGFEAVVARPVLPLSAPPADAPPAGQPSESVRGK
jgi:hypothetical protein